MVFLNNIIIACVTQVQVVMEGIELTTRKYLVARRNPTDGIAHIIEEEVLHQERLLGNWSELIERNPPS